MDDNDIHTKIDQLIADERDLRDQLGRGELTVPEEHAKLKATEEQLDRLWDLLRQRQAKREFGENPDEASERSAATVENYEG